MSLSAAALKTALKSERAKSAQLERDLSVARAIHHTPAPRPAKQRREKEDRIAVVFPDVHGSYQDPAAVSAFLGDVRKLDPDIVVGLGDLVDCGGFLAQHHTLGFVAEAAYTYEQDLADAAKFLDAVAKAAPRAEMHALEGNHDMRPEKWAVTAALRNELDAAWLTKLVSPQAVLKFRERGIRYYRRSETYGGATVQGCFAIGKLHFAHGLLNGNNTPAQVLNRFSGMNVVYGHSHQVQSKVQRTSSGPVGAWNIGTLAKLQPLYAHSSPTTWSHAFGVVAFARSGAFQFTTVTIAKGKSLLSTRGLQ